MRQRVVARVMASGKTVRGTTRTVAAQMGLVFISLSLIWGIMEIILRRMPVLDCSRWTPVAKDSPVLRYEPKQVLTWSKGWRMSGATQRKSNNVGFLNDQDYSSNGTRPLVAVVGDSYVEALMNPYNETFYGILAKEVGENGRVYSFGLSGAPLSQYLIWADFAKRAYQSNALIVVIVGNDFDECFYQYKPVRGLHYFDPKSTLNNIILQRVDRIDSFSRRTIMKLASARYVFYNLRVGHSLHKWRTGDVRRRQVMTIEYEGDVPTTVSPNRLRDSKLAANLFLAALPEYSGLPPDRILLVLDGVRPSLYKGDGTYSRESFWGTMHDYMMANANDLGFEIIDMNTTFTSQYIRYGDRFEFPTDDHWNGFGHKLVAEQILNSKLMTTVFSGHTNANERALR